MKNTVHSVSIPIPEAVSREAREKRDAKWAEEKKRRLQWIDGELEHERANGRPGLVTDRFADLLRERAKLTGEPQMRAPSASEESSRYRKTYISARDPRAGWENSTDGMIYRNVGKPVVAASAIGGAVLSGGTAVPAVLTNAGRLAAAAVTAGDFTGRIADGETVGQAAADTARTWVAAGTRGILTSADSVLAAADTVLPDDSAVAKVTKMSRQDLARMMRPGPGAKLLGTDFDTRFSTYRDDRSEAWGKYLEMHGRYGALGDAAVATDAIGSLGTDPSGALTGAAMMAGGRWMMNRPGAASGITGFLLDFGGFMKTGSGIEDQRDAIMYGLDRLDDTAAMKADHASVLGDVVNGKPGNAFDRWWNNHVKEQFGSGPLPEYIDEYREFQRNNFIDALRKGAEDE